VRSLNWRDAATGKPGDTETVLSGLGRGGEKRLSNETSLAAYFIALPQNALSAGKLIPHMRQYNGVAKVSLLAHGYRNTHAFSDECKCARFMGGNVRRAWAVRERVNARHEQSHERSCVADGELLHHRVLLASKRPNLPRNVQHSSHEASKFTS
jgi:hypothetical protein